MGCQPAISIINKPTNLDGSQRHYAISDYQAQQWPRGATNLILQDDLCVLWAAQAGVEPAVQALLWSPEGGEWTLGLALNLIQLDFGFALR